MSSPVVHLSSDSLGPSVKGLISHAKGSDKPVYGFLGMPYAEPPVGKLRFRPPQQAQLWKGVRDGTRYGSCCPQDLERMQRTHGMIPNLPKDYSEDCLFLNVWTPTIDRQTQAKLPVMVWSHGGAFVQGFGNVYDGTPMAAYENVVVVSINYRLGVFGFLRTGGGSDDYKGNQGLLDQLEALRWIKQHIHNFGGDPDNVTVFGESAGGISISFLQTADQARGLFRRSICESGPGIYPNAIWSPAGTEKYFNRRLQSMGYKGNSSAELTRFLDTKSTDDYLKTFNDWFVPSVIDGEYIKRDPEISYNMGLFHPVDTIIGFNSHEGMNYTPPDINNREDAIKTIQSMVSNNFYRGKNPALAKKVADLSVDQYVGRWIGDNMTEAVCEFRGDVNFVGPSLRQAELHSTKARTYVYQFDHRPWFSPYAEWVRADHGHELPYVWGYPFRSDLPDLFPEEEKPLSRTIMHYWANFAKTGNPNGSDGLIWNQFTKDQPLYLPITVPQGGSANAREVFGERMTLWTKTVPDIHEQYRTHMSKY